MTPGEPFVYACDRRTGTELICAAGPGPDGPSMLETRSRTLFGTVLSGALPPDARGRAGRIRRYAEACAADPALLSFGQLFGPGDAPAPPGWRPDSIGFFVQDGIKRPLWRKAPPGPVPDGALEFYRIAGTPDMALLSLLFLIQEHGVLGACSQCGRVFVRDAKEATLCPRCENHGEDGPPLSRKDLSCPTFTR